MTRPRTISGTPSKSSVALVEKSIQIMSTLADSSVESFYLVLVKLNVHQEANDMSGSRGEANFVWKCKSCKVRDHESPVL